MKYLKLFNNDTEYQQFIDGEDYIEHHIVGVKTNQNTPSLKFKEKVELINFYLYNIKYQCEEGMTWRDFVNSKYNIETIYKRFEINENINGVNLENSLEFIFKMVMLKLNHLI
jgi:hypothetical protein